MSTEDPHMKSWKVILVCGWIFAVVLFLTAWHMACAADLQVSWNANTEPDLAGYKVYYAMPSDPGWILDGGRWLYTLETLPRSQDAPTNALIMPITEEGAYAVGVTALDAAGNESDLSEIKSTYYLVPDVIVVPPVDVPPDRPVQVIMIINLVQ